MKHSRTSYEGRQPGKWIHSHSGGLVIAVSCDQIPIHPSPLGKIERVFRTVRLRFQPRLTDRDLGSDDPLQERLEPWLREDYGHYEITVPQLLLRQCDRR